MRYETTASLRTIGQLTVADGIDRRLDRPVHVMVAWVDQRAARRLADAVERLAAQHLAHVPPILDVWMGDRAGSGESRVMWALLRRPGMALPDWVGAEGPVPRPAGFRVLDQVAASIDAITAAGLVVDVTPHDVIVEGRADAPIASVLPVARPANGDGAVGSDHVVTAMRAIAHELLPGLREAAASTTAPSAAGYVAALRAIADRPQVAPVQRSRRTLVAALLAALAIVGIGGLLLATRSGDDAAQTTTTISTTTTSAPTTTTTAPTTTTAVPTTEAITTTTTPPAPPSLGYRLVLDRGIVVDRGSVPAVSNIGNLAGAAVAGAATTPDGLGLWLVTADGGVAAAGSAAPIVDLVDVAFPPSAPIVDAVSDGSGGGLWLIGADGAVYAVGTAVPLPPLAAPLTSPAVDAVAVPGRAGLLIASIDGTVTSVGDAPALVGEPDPFRLSAVVSIAIAPSGEQAWLVESSGRIIPLGGAAPIAGVELLPLNRPIVRIAATPTGDGLWLLAADGGVFALGAAPAFEPYLVDPGVTAVDFVVVA
jgi:hypothetical protein